MELTITLAKHFDMTPFDLNREDLFEVIDFINYFIDKGTETKKKPPEQPISDGFWDFD